jgi:archaellum component FlaC
MSDEDENKNNDQNIPPEVLEKLPPEVKSQLGIEEKKEPKTLFAPGTDTSDISESLARLREGFEKIGLTLIGRMGEFTTTLERVSLTVQRIDKVESSASEANYNMKKIEKKLDEFNVNFTKMADKYEEFSFVLNQIKNDIAELKGGKITSVTQPTQAIKTQKTQIQAPAATVEENPTEPTTQPEMEASIPEQAKVQPIVPEPPEAPKVSEAQEVEPSKFEVQLPDIEGEPIARETPTIEIPDIEGEPIKPNAQPEVEIPQIEGGAIEKEEEKPMEFKEDATSDILLEMTFDSLIEQIQVNMPFFKMADILDSTRDSLQKSIGWDPVIYQIGKEARNLRRNEGNLDDNTVTYLQEKINEWKNKLAKK